MKAAAAAAFPKFSPLEDTEGQATFCMDIALAALRTLHHQTTEALVTDKLGAKAPPRLWFREDSNVQLTSVLSGQKLKR